MYLQDLCCRPPARSSVCWTKSGDSIRSSTFCGMTALPSVADFGSPCLARFLSRDFAWLLLVSASRRFSRASVVAADVEETLAWISPANKSWDRGVLTGDSRLFASHQVNRINESPERTYGGANNHIFLTLRGPAVLPRGPSDAAVKLPADRKGFPL